MRTFISDLIPKLQRFSQKLDNLTLLTNQHWVVIDDISNNKNVYIFRANNDLFISQNGKVEKAKWEYLGNNSLLIDRKDESYLFKHGFFDENILALKVDSKDEYAFLINENKYDGELNSIDRIIDFLTKKYIEPQTRKKEPQTRKNSEETNGVRVEQPTISIEPVIVLMAHKSDKGTLEIEQTHSSFPDINPGRKAFISGKPAPDGKYKLGFMWNVHIKDGQVLKITLF
jgi:hypothetical protein